MSKRKKGKSSKKKKPRKSATPWLLGVVLVVVGLFLLIKVGITVLQPEVAEEATSFTTTTTPDPTKEITDDISSFFDEPVCTNVSAEEEQGCLDSKWAEAAYDYMNIRLCNNIANTTLRSHCKGNVTFAAASAAENPERCEEIDQPELAKKCQFELYKRMAVAQANYSICDNIKDSVLRRDCRDHVHYYNFGPGSQNNSSQ